jgi:hypothetical protein
MFLGSDTTENALETENVPLTENILLHNIAPQPQTEPTVTNKKRRPNHNRVHIIYL